MRAAGNMNHLECRKGIAMAHLFGAPQRRAFRWLSGALLLSLALTANLGCGKRDKVTPPEDLTTIQRVARGWQAFERGDFDAAISDFDRAVNDSASYGDAHLGRAWTRLSRATSSADLGNAIASFDSAELLGFSGAESKGGRAAARLGQGGTSLPSAVLDARAALTANPTFSFSHRSSFDFRDLRLIEAYAEAGQLEYSDALTAADLVSASNIQEGNPSTWTVDGVTLPSFATAVLAHLQKLSNQFAG